MKLQYERLRGNRPYEGDSDYSDHSRTPQPRMAYVPEGMGYIPQGYTDGMMNYALPNQVRAKEKGWKTPAPYYQLISPGFKRPRPSKQGA